MTTESLLNPANIAQLALHHRWVPLSALAIGLVVRLLKDDTRFPTIPARARIWLVLALGAVAGVLQKVGDGLTWQEAALGGVFSIGLAVVGHEAFIESARGGQEIPLPGVLLKPKTIPEAVETAPAEVHPSSDSAEAAPAVVKDNE